MKILAVLDHLGAAASASPTARRAALAHLGAATWRTAAAALPAVAAVLRPAPAAAAVTGTTLDAVLLLGQLERTQVAFYTQALAVPGLLPAGQVADFQLILAHQQAHLALLNRALTDGGVRLPAPQVFDFSGRRGVPANPDLFGGALGNYAAFLQLAQHLEDLGGRTYLGLLPDLLPQALLYAAALQLLATETRHASHLRTLRRGQGAAVKNWPTPAPGFGPPALPPQAAALATALTLGENDGRQLVGATLVPYDTLLVAANNAVVGPSAVAEAFDEPLLPALAQAALDLFVAG